MGGFERGEAVLHPFTYEIRFLISSRLENKASLWGNEMADDILNPDKSGNSRAAQTRIKGKSAGAIGGQRAHDLRIGPQPAYVDPNRAHLNRVLIAPQTGTQLRKVCEDRRTQRATKRAMKSSAAVGMIGIITFGHEAQKIFETLAPDQQDAAYRETAEAIAKRLNTTLTGLVAHGDESAPHAHFQLPAYDLTGHPISETAKRGALRDLQTITAEVMGRHAPGIERGHSKLDRLKAGATPAEVVNRSVAQLHDELPIEIAEKEARLVELNAKIDKNKRLAASALKKAATNEAKADKALKNAALYEKRAEKARQERDAEERALSNLQLDRRKEEERLELLRRQQEKILRENDRITEKGQRKVEALTAEVSSLEAENSRLKIAVQEQKDFIADAERIADIQWDRASAAMDAQSNAEDQMAALKKEAAQIREKALREAQKAADALLEQAQDEGAKEALRVTKEVSKRLEQKLLTDDQKALLSVERERDQWKAGFELFRDIVKSLVPTELYQTIRNRFFDGWSKHPVNPDRKLETPRSHYSGPSGP